jgi:hypothetical protein
MAISPKQFVATTEFHQKNLNALLEQYIDLPEAPGILAAMLYLQRSIQAAKTADSETEKDKK